MAGTGAAREAELERIRRSESNNYNDFGRGGKPSASDYNPGFNKTRSPKDPNKTSADTPGPNGRG